jgi:peptidoglycan/xylan/chitin deacetylase (PgdA/CDA1 family)
MLFWDYDTQWGADRSRLPGGAKAWGIDEFVNTERLLEIHAEFDVRACFAVVGAAALPGDRPYHDPVQIRRIRRAGHEVASHSFRHEWLPGLSSDQLEDTLRSSKDALEQCLGEEVAAFVPPYNQPFDYPAGLALSLSERREARGTRTNLSGLCRALKYAGYRFCRVAYRPLPLRLVERLTGRRFARRSTFEWIAGIRCVRLNAPAGFDGAAIRALDRCAQKGGLAVIYGHPHSLRAEGAQNEGRLRSFLERVSYWRTKGRLKVLLPSDGQSGS